MTQYVYWLSQVVEDGFGPTTTTPVTTGAPTGPCFTTGSCDATGEEHVGTVYGVDTAEECQLKCEENLLATATTSHGMSQRASVDCSQSVFPLERCVLTVSRDQSFA